MEEKKFIDGNTAIAYGVMLSKPDIVAAYPITPQTKIVEKLSEFIADGEMDTEYIKVESEHSAGSACFGAASAGVRTFTATSSQGLAYMHEMLHYISGSRLPVVMGVVNRSLAPPWGIWVDHQDSISTRDTGWIQFYIETAQEALDTIIQAFRIAENKRVMTPTMVCLDAFVLSHTDEMVRVPHRKEVDLYLQPYQPEHFLAVDNPCIFSAGAIPKYYYRYKHEQQRAIRDAQEIIVEADEEFASIWGRSYGGLVDSYRLDDAQAVIMVMGSTAGVVRDVVDNLRQKGSQVGMIRVRTYRPFPSQSLAALLETVPSVAVIDRNCSFGFEGALFTDLKASLYRKQNTRVYGFIAGFGGQEITPGHIEKMYHALLQKDALEEKTYYIGMGCFA